MSSTVRWSLDGRIGRAGVAWIVAWTASATFGQPISKVQDWPKEPITFVAPFSPGGGGDTLARTFAGQFAAGLGITVIVENRPGAGGNVGTASVARAPADGQTLVFGTMGTMGTNHALYKKTGYSISDFEPVAMFGSTALVLVVGPNSAFRTVNELVDQGRRHPGELTCASGGNGTVSHVACALLQQMTGVEFNHVPYKASSAAYIDLMGDRVSFMIDVVPPLVPQISSGKLRAVAVSMKQRIPALPEVPPVAETVQGFEVYSWDGMFAPKGTTPERLDRLHGAVSAALTNPEFVKTMSSRGYTLTVMPRREFAEFVRKEHVRMRAVVRKMGISLD
jgi:tripartite-type tricarboxylate transporter receptor subunit TctC